MTWLLAIVADVVLAVLVGKWLKHVRRRMWG